MKMKDKRINLILFITLINLGYLIFIQFGLNQHLKTAVVQMDNLVLEYDGRKAATELYAEKMSKWQAGADTLASQIASLENVLKQKKKPEDSEEYQRWINLNRQYKGYQKQIQEEAQKDDETLTLGVLNQLNTYIKEYAETNGYDLVLANTNLENVAYAKEQVDITEPLLEYANQRYHDTE